MKRYLSIFATATVALLSAASVAFAAPALNQTSVTIGLGQSTTVSSTATATAVYRMSTSNPNVASIQINGTQITIVGASLGSTTLSICYVNTSTDCTNLSVTVTDGTQTTSSALSFSQNAPTMTIGQSLSITISGGNGSYYLGGNSNSTIVSASVNGSIASLSALAAGNSTITVCAQTGGCGTINVTVSTNGSSSGSLSFSNQSATIVPGQTLVITATGGSGYYVSGNTMPDTVPVSINGSQISVSGNQIGSSVITICSTSNGCGTLNITVSATGGSTSGSQAVTFSNMSPSLAVGQSLTVTVGGTASSYFVTSNPAPAVANATLSGNTITLTGTGAGTSSMTVCGTSGGCNTFNITVTGSTTTTGTTTTTQTPAVTTPVNTGASLTSVIQAMQLQLTQMLAQIQVMATALNQLATAMGASTSATSNTSVSASSYTFTQFLDVGSDGAEVSALQQRLKDLGYFSGSVTGHFGALTQAAVMKFQSARGIDAKGYVGPATQAALNAR